MRHRLVFVLWILGWVACAPQAPAPTAPERPSPTEAPAPSSPTPSRVPSPMVPRVKTVTPTPPPRIAPLPDGFHTEGDWLFLFRAISEHDPLSYQAKARWLTNGQRWIGPWPSYIIDLNWIRGDGDVQLCHSKWANSRWEVRCVSVPPQLGIQFTSPDEQRGGLGGSYLRPAELMGNDLGAAMELACGGKHNICIRFSDGSRSAPVRLPLPEHVNLKDYSPFRDDIGGCLSPDQQHAIVSLPRMGGPVVSGFISEPNPVLEPRFTGGAYWIDLRAGHALTAPTNAPTWPAQQALLRSMVARGNFPRAVLPLFEQSLIEPTGEGKIGKISDGKVFGSMCSPSGRFVLWRQATWPSWKTPVLWIWVLRLSDGVGYPLTIVRGDKDSPVSVAASWVYHSSLDRMMSGDDILVTPEYSPPWQTP